MTFLRRMKSFTLFKYLVLPALLLCAVIKKPAMQWIALLAVLLWIGLIAFEGVFRINQQRKRKSMSRRKPVPPQAPVSDGQSTPRVDQDIQTAHNELFLIRQVNYRITEQLKTSYPLVSWLWLVRPDASQLCQGGRFRIRTYNTDPFNYGEVELSDQGRLTITMLQAVPLRDAVAMELAAKDDLTQEDLLERVDVRTWYRDQGEQVLCQMIDDLNTQGHKKLLIKEDGNVVIDVAGKEQSVDLLKNFPPRIVWEDFCQILREDEITASIQNEGLALSW